MQPLFNRTSYSENLATSTQPSNSIENQNPISMVLSNIALKRFIDLDKPVGSTTYVDLKDKDIYTMSTFNRRIKDSYKHKLGYIIAVVQDAYKNVRLYDGCEFTRDIYVHNHRLSAATRTEIDNAYFYRLSSPYEFFISDNESNIDYDTFNDQVKDFCLKFQYICDLKDISPEYDGNYPISLSDVSPEDKSYEWFLSFIGAHHHIDKNSTTETKISCASDRQKIGLLYHEGWNKFINVNHSSFQKIFNQDKIKAVYWYERTLDIKNINDICYINAYFNLAEFYDEGIVVEQSSQKAFEYNKLAVEKIKANYLKLDKNHIKGVVKALAFRHMFGIGTKTNIREAKNLLNFLHSVVNQLDPLSIDTSEIL